MVVVSRDAVRWPSQAFEVNEDDIWVQQWFFLIVEVANDDGTRCRDTSKLARVSANHRPVVTHRHELCADIRGNFSSQGIVVGVFRGAGYAACHGGGGTVTLVVAIVWKCPWNLQATSRITLRRVSGIVMMLCKMFST